MKTLAAAAIAVLLAATEPCFAEIPTFEKRESVWGSEITYAVGQLGCGVALADWDGDGVSDIIAANGDGEVFVVPYDPANALLLPEDIKRLNLTLPGPTLIGKIPSKYPGADPVILEIADKNGDGRRDVVLRDRFGQDWLLLRRGRIMLDEAKPLGEPHKDWKRAPEFPRVRGKMGGPEDVELTGRPANFEVRRGKDEPYLEGYGGFAWHGREGYDPNFDIVDLDGDGRKDIVTVAVARSPGRSPRTVLFHKGRVGPKGTGLVFSGGRVLFDDVQAHNVIAAADLNGDGLFDLILSRPGFFVLWNEGTKTEPKFTKKIKVEGVRDEEAVNLVDWDGDGLLDIVASRWHDADHSVHVSFYRNLGKKAPELAFAEPAEVLFDGKKIASNCPAVAVVDLDGDGDLDIVMVIYGGAVCFAENKAGKGKPPVLAAPVPLMDSEGQIKFGTRNTAIRVVDLNGDGKLDLLLSTEYDGFDVGKEVVVWYGK